MRRGSVIGFTQEWSVPVEKAVLGETWTPRLSVVIPKGDTPEAAHSAWLTVNARWAVGVTSSHVDVAQGRAGRE